MRNSPTAEFGYVRGLDALRLAAVTIVIVRHYEIVKVLPGGFGVSVFFFISGFLISRLLLAEEKKFDRGIKLGAFYTRRFIRLLPPLVLMGVVSIPVLYALFPEDFSVVQVVMSFLYLGNLVKFGAEIFGWNPGLPAIEPLWSLAVEEHFYLLLPPALLLFRSIRARIWIMGFAIVLPLVLRLWIYAAVEQGLADEINYHFTFTRLDSMAWGVLLTLLLEARKLREPRGLVAGSALVGGGAMLMLASMVHWSDVYEIALKYSFQGIAIGVFVYGVLFATSFGWLRGLMEWRPFVHLGRISYEMYLWHFPILATVAYFVPGRGGAVLLSLVLTVLISELAYRVTTKRLSDLRKRFGGHPVS